MYDKLVMSLLMVYFLYFESVFIFIFLNNHKVGATQPMNPTKGNQLVVVAAIARLKRRKSEKEKKKTKRIGFLDGITSTTTPDS